MAIEDKIKWDKKYSTTPKLLEKRECSKKLQNILSLVKGKRALDIACGAGKNSLHLANMGFDVVALDISSVALETLDEYEYSNIKTKLTDLEGFTPLENSYDLIVMTNYLDRELIPNLLKALTKDGILFIETYMEYESNSKKSSNPDFLLQKEELKSFVDKNYSILEYDEFDNEPYELYRMRKQSISVQRIVL